MSGKYINYIKWYIGSINSISGIGKLKFAATAPILFVYNKIKGKRDNIKNITRFDLTVKVYGHKFECRKNTLDISYIINFEPETTEFLLNKKGKIFIDVGAHIGRYSILLSKNFEKIISIEADPYNYSQLIRNTRLNSLWNKVIPLNIALTNNDGILKLNLSEEGDGTHSIVVNYGKGSIEVLGLKLDTVIDLLGIDPKDIDVIKIDVEGAEYFVLQGMKKALKDGKPVLVIEIWEDSKYKEKTIELLKKYGYKMIKELDKGYATNYIFVKE
ncbi:MAG: hypothetical protein BXU00_02835 [Candidatus Nanoclepta minutus]|uniref:Methyltransferase FkbM domain-containing protein n=1 Tax=Candidatus Nanoclepta minutus TaxID=1940235 RepID=A0A397WNS6_9ARCH|nr:MAG: hypothetical protein BXU00_02835 [Candidatus Nanoclepta minutus]